MHDLAPAPAVTELPRLVPRAKFFFEGDRKFYLQGVTYGPFRPSTPHGPSCPRRKKPRSISRLMREIGVNVIRVYHTPPRWFLDLAQAERIRVMVTIPWHKRVLFLDDREAVGTIQRNVAEAAIANAGHPAMLGFFIDNEIPSDLVRWYGAPRMEEFLNGLVRIVKQHDPRALAAYANFPPTEYLLPSEVDFYSYNVYLHRKKDLVGYLAPPAEPRRRQAAYPLRIRHGHDPPSRGRAGRAAGRARHHRFRKRAWRARSSFPGPTNGTPTAWTCSTGPSASSRPTARPR